MDLKKIIAYSTCSQMGYLVLCAGIAKFDISFFHLVNHAFFKCLLFISAGVLIHSFYNEQDIRKYGGLIKLFPFVWIILIIASLSLMGFPFLSGFYSKEKIIEYSYYIYNSNNLIGFWFSNLSAFLTAIYSIRLISFIFLLKPNNYKKHYENLNLNFPFIINFVLFSLGLCTLISGFIFEDLIIGPLTNWYNYTSNFFNLYNLNIHFGNFNLNFLTFKYTILGMLIYSLFYILKNEINFLFYYYYNNKFFKTLNSKIFSLSNNSEQKRSINFFYHIINLKFIYFFFNKKWFLNFIYNSYVTKFIFYIGYFWTFKILEKGYLEFLSFFFFINYFNKFSSFIIFKFYKFNYFEEILFLIFLTFFICTFIFSSLNIYEYSLNELVFLILLLAVPKKKRSIIKLKKQCLLYKLTNKFFFIKN